MIIRRFGLINAIVWMMIAAGFGLGALAPQPAAVTAVLGYCAYMAFQWMSEPGLNTVLMNNVREEERNGASSINYLVAFSAQAVAAYWAGRLLEGFGYPPVLFGAALLVLLAAFLFRTLVRENKDHLATDEHR